MMKHSRLGELVRAFWAVAAYAVLGCLWLLFFRHFVVVIAARVVNLWRAGPVANTPPCYSPDCDFSMFWPAGLMARAGDLTGLYQSGPFLVWRHQLLFAGAQRLDWFYPPPSLLPAMAVSYLPFQSGFFIWTLVFILAALLLLRWARLPWSVILLSLLSPAALLTVEMGQLGIFCGACVVAGLLMADRAPVRGGSLLGLLLLKPQTALLAPLAVLVRRNWRAVASGLAVAIALLAAVTVLLGWRVWPAFELPGQLVFSQFIRSMRPIGMDGGISILWMMRSFGINSSMAYVAQGIGVLLAVWVMWRGWRAAGLDPMVRMALVVFASLWVVPYGYVNDMVAYSIALAALARQRGWRLNGLDGLLWLWPALCPVVVSDTGILLTPLVVAVAVLRGWSGAGLGWRLLPAGRSVLPGST